jgi:lysophospholipase L1-like esterase
MRHPRFCRRWFPVIVSTALLGASSQVSLGLAAEPVADRWEETIAAFEASDRESPPAKGGVLFVGSSSIRLWKLDRWFPDLAAMNRGFGGSQIADVNRYTARIVLPSKPRTILFYAGDNDINAKKSPEQVAADFKAFVAMVHAELPEATIHFIAIKPSLKRWEQYGTQQQANSLVRAMCQSDPRLTYIDVVTPMLGNDGKPRPELFADDGLHLNDTGYALWTEIVSPLLTKTR